MKTCLIKNPHTQLSLIAVFSLMVPTVLRADDYIYATNNGTITITQYIGPGGEVTVPDTINGLPVTNIGDGAFANAWLGNGVFTNSSMISIVIPDSITNMGMQVFVGCNNLVSVNLPNTIPVIGFQDFADCGLTNFTIPNSVWIIENQAFDYCWNLTNVIIPKSVNTVMNAAFNGCHGLVSAYFGGDLPSSMWSSDPPVFAGDNQATVYYLPNAKGWGSTYGGARTKVWQPVITSYGVQNNQFGFNINWASGSIVSVEVSLSDLKNPVWWPLQSVVLTDGTCFFSDPQWTNFPSRFYRVRPL